jgi:formylglycine-generating enzyme required for sulfatase activity
LIQSQAWTAENTDGSAVRQVGASEANAAGIHDLIGNVEEWLMAAPGETRAPVLGGSILTPLGKAMSAREVFKREKNRTLGFRIVIE